MKTLANEIREAMDKLDEYNVVPHYQGFSDNDDDSVEHIPDRKGKSHVVPKTPEGLLAKYLNNEISGILKAIENSKIDDNIKQEIEAKLMELGALVQKKLQ